MIHANIAKFVDIHGFEGIDKYYAELARGASSFG
jgi:hypothetical protein